MKRLVSTDLGGFPFVSDDLRFIESGVMEALSALVSPYIGSSNGLIISGCDRTIVGGNINISEGFIFLQGEIYYVPAQTVLDEGKTYNYFEVLENYDPAGEKQFQNSATHDTYAVRIAQIVQSDTLPVDAINYPNLDTVIGGAYKAMGFQEIKDWVNLPDARYVTPSVQGPAQIYRDRLGFVHFRGNWNHDDPGASFIIGTLPVGYRPDVDIVFNYLDAKSSNPATIFGYQISISASTGVIDVLGTNFPQEFEMMNFPSFLAVI